MGVYRLKFPCESAFLIRIQVTFYLEGKTEIQYTNAYIWNLERW